MVTIARVLDSFVFGRKDHYFVSIGFFIAVGTFLILLITRPLAFVLRSIYHDG